MGTAAAPRRFCRCACFCSENLYVARYGLHVRFRSEQQLRQDYEPILRSRGCVSPKDFQQLLGELEQEVERRRRLGPESAARKALIASSYRPARPEVYNLLQEAALAPEFLAAAEYSASSGADLKGLLQRLETVSEEKRIYRLPVFTAPFCQALLEELEHFEQSDMPKGRPNTMNNYGVLLHELGLDEPLVTPLRERFLQPLMALLYPDCGGGWLDSHRAFVVKYAPGQDRELGCHYDNAELTLNVSLGKAFTGGALYFGDLFQVPSTLAKPLEVEHVVGQGLLHRGGQLHGARPLGTGERWNLVVWLRASAVRNRLCPMCCRKPDLVDDEGFGDGFTREEPATVDVCALT
ncbi:2-oxoglutarate and iron-dependent oxygenase domain-containing protein 2 isoform X1 [Bos indicus]|uniref:2-oxoglutarate and iron dependent oxygenase domain containing 2 n=3 Tax=Bos TaxID=9903 RepID=A0AAA9SK47_BOVIN|nr:2-oxoglutarate and iron-dependent oxygenase domain-containing protein 2 isoform X1 [Bos taurus]XP_019833467.1 PREDICTED: 2-oxoglutarate and iron-dependent oxygenase domain-containing protein 2 [Bos indicus]XP_027422736.1 2-oxoglutarate and iron-dependent oxygenase domain-containing protein 2 isoform X1 [Bos indicus x Bos taurus]DAA20669.1 TPA: 2-oxoglutarate and iron-dependent oxygenase domain containing 2 [Bos taurus]